MRKDFKKNMNRLNFKNGQNISTNKTDKSQTNTSPSYYRMSFRLKINKSVHLSLLHTSRRLKIKTSSIRSYFIHHYFWPSFHTAL